MIFRLWIAALSALLLAAISGCATQAEGSLPKDQNTMYEESTAKSVAPRCPAGYVLQCESRNTGRIRFGRIGNKNLENCACEHYQGMPTQSPLPGIQ